MTDTPCLDHLIRCNHETGQWFDPSFLPRCRAELSALKARVEAAEKEVSERGKDVSMLTSYLRHAVMCGDPYGNCWTCTKARELLTRIDAALQAAREGVVRASDPEWFKTDPPMRSKLTGWNPMSDGGSE